MWRLNINYLFIYEKIKKKNWNQLIKMLGIFLFLNNTNCWKYCYERVFSVQKFATIRFSNCCIHYRRMTKTNILEHPICKQPLNMRMCIKKKTMDPFNIFQLVVLS